MPPRTVIALLSCSLLALASKPATAQKKNANQKTWTDPVAAAKEHPGFKLQGEYATQGRGVQVVALDKDMFRVVAYPGGLPGLGWTGKDKTVRDETGTAVRERLARGFQKIVRTSTTLGMKPPQGAVVLFDGSVECMKNWKKGATRTSDGLLQQGATSIPTFQAARIHVEFCLPYKPHARGQGRGNSGLYVQGRYETQMLDSFGLEGKHNECGGIYSVRAPSVNACLPPLRWQTYDIDFVPASYDSDGKKSANAKMTVRLNGILIHEDVAVPKRTTASPLKEGPEAGPIFLQNHGNPVRYRNIWVLPR